MCVRPLHALKVWLMGVLAVQVRVAILHFTMQHEQGTEMQSSCSSMQAQ